MFFFHFNKELRYAYIVFIPFIEHRLLDILPFQHLLHEFRQYVVF